MSFELFQEGGPLKAKKTGSDQYSMSVSIPKDEDGRVARECPNQECSPSYFKVTPGTGIPAAPHREAQNLCRHSRLALPERVNPGFPPAPKAVETAFSPDGHTTPG